jgi:hypothetical protein
VIGRGQHVRIGSNRDHVHVEAGGTVHIEENLGVLIYEPGSSHTTGSDQPGVIMSTREAASREALVGAGHREAHEFLAVNDAKWHIKFIEESIRRHEATRAEIRAGRPPAVPHHRRYSYVPPTEQSETQVIAELNTSLEGARADLAAARGRQSIRQGELEAAQRHLSEVQSDDRRAAENH